jgi:hypothetical protein
MAVSVHRHGCVGGLQDSHMRTPLALLRGADISKISKDRKLSIPHSASREAFCGDGNVSHSNGVHASHGIPQVAIHKLHPQALELSMFLIREERCNDHRHLHLHASLF